MKKIYLILIAVFTILLLADEAEAKSRSDYGLFYTALAPHGVWIELDHGVVVWKPSIVRRGWAPYTRGQWLWTEDGWYWHSYEDFGYITYHYGRWFYDDYYGWIWLPDYEWAPAWVEWRYDDDYIGWAPLPPYAVFSVNIGIHFTVNYYTPIAHWHFVKYRHFCDPHVYNYYAAPKYRERIFSKTKYRNDYSYERGRVVNRGVDVNLIRERSGQEIRQRDIIRTADLREIERGNGRNNETIRTFAASRDIIERESGNVEIKRSDRKSNLQTEKVEISRREVNTNRSDDKKITEERNNRTTTKDIERIPVNNKSVDKQNENERNRIQSEKKEKQIVDKKVQVKQQKNKVQIEKRNERENSGSIKRERETVPQKNSAPEIRQQKEQKPKNNVPQIKPETRQNKVEVREQKRTEPRTERNTTSTERSRETPGKTRTR